jgi:hypothetical protein
MQRFAEFDRKHCAREAVTNSLSCSAAAEKNDVALQQKGGNVPTRHMTKQFGNHHRMERAQTIALQALAFLLSEPAQLERFLSETGLAPEEIRARAQSAEVLEAALSVLLDDEALLLTFAANASIPPQDVVQAHDDLATDGGRLTPQSST